VIRAGAKSRREAKFRPHIVSTHREISRISARLF
jgi:hypothetical protein